MSRAGIDIAHVSPVMAPTLIQQEKEQSKIAIPSEVPQQRPSLQPLDDDGPRQEAIHELKRAQTKLNAVEGDLKSYLKDFAQQSIEDQALRNLLESVRSTRGNLDRAQSAAEAVCLATPPSFEAEKLAGDRRHQIRDSFKVADRWQQEAAREMQAAINHQPKGSDPLLNVNTSSLGMAKAVGEIMNHHAWRLDRNTSAVQQLTELRGLLEHHKHLDKVDFSDLPERAQKLLEVARQHGVLWPESEGWKDARERDARIQGIEFATQSLSKTGEQLTLRLQFAQNTYNQHLMNAAYALHRQAKIIELVLQLLARS